MPVIDLKKQERTVEARVDKRVTDELNQKRYYVAELVKKALDKYLDFDDMVANNNYSLYTLPIINEELNIIDFEINSLSVHVIATVDKAKNENVYIPAIYKQFYYKPDMFLFVNFTKTLAKMDIVGFLTDFNFKNLSIPKSDLNSGENLIDALQNLKPERAEGSSNVVNTINELILAYIDNDLSDEGKRFFLKYMLQNKAVRRNYKMFYSLNCDFVSIARNSRIEKEDPFERERRIDIPTRSSYLLDKAISKYNAEEFLENNSANIVEEETVEEEVVEKSEEIQNISSPVISADNVLELSLDTITAAPAIGAVVANTPVEAVAAASVAEDIMQDFEEQEQEQNSKENNDENAKGNDTQEQQETISDKAAEEDKQENFAETNIVEYNNVGEAETDIPTEQIVYDYDENAEYSFDDTDNVIDLSASGEEDFSLNLRDDEEEPVIEKIQTEKFHSEEPEKQVYEVNLAQSDSTNNLLADNEDADLLDIAIDENIEDDIAYVAEDNIQNIEPQTVVLQENTTENNNEDDDLFAFLSEIADENPDNQEMPQQVVLEEPTYQNLPQNEGNAQDENQFVANNYSQSSGIENNQQEDISQAVFEQKMQEPDMAEDMSQNAFTQIPIHQQEAQYSQVYTQSAENQKTKKGSNPVFMLAATLVIVGAIGYANLDTFNEMFSGSEQVAGLEEEKPAEDIPTPIDAAQLDANAVNDTTTANSDTNTGDAVAPPPTAADNSQSSEEGIPSVDKAPQVPNAPTTTVEPPKPKHINDAIATALSKDFNGVRISKLSWQASETLVSNPEVKRYLTIAGKSIKNSLSQDLLAATEPSFKDSVSVSVTYKKDGSVADIQMATSSGSKQIDDIIIKSVKSTLGYIKMPALNLTTEQYTAKIIIRL